MVGKELSFIPAINLTSFRVLLPPRTDGWEDINFVARVSELEGIVADQNENDKEGDVRWEIIEVVWDKNKSSSRTSASSRMIRDTLETGKRSGQS